MRYSFIALILGAALAGCAGSSSPAPKPTPTTGDISRVEAVPTTTAPPIRGGRSTAPAATHPGSTSAPTPAAITKLPTPRGITFVTPTPFPASAYSAAIRGRVIDARGHTPVAGALVTVGSGHVTHTDAHGQYYVTFPTGADVPVEVTKRGFASSLAMGSISPHKTVTLNFTLVPIIAHHPITPPPPTFFGHR